jgi:hypothetical protein
MFGVWSFSIWVEQEAARKEWQENCKSDQRDGYYIGSRELRRVDFPECNYRERRQAENERVQSFVRALREKSIRKFWSSRADVLGLMRQPHSRRHTA